MKYTPILFSLLLSLLFAACGPDYIYEKAYKLNEEGWAYQDTLNFEINIDDTLGLYHLYL